MTIDELHLESLRVRRLGELNQAKADALRMRAYKKRSKVNALFAEALHLKDEAYDLESRTKSNDDPVWKKIYTLKYRAFVLEMKANGLNTLYYIDSTVDLNPKDYDQSLCIDRLLDLFTEERELVMKRLDELRREQCDCESDNGLGYHTKECDMVALGWNEALDAALAIVKGEKK